jgi:hypothetical protein
MYVSTDKNPLVFKVVLGFYPCLAKEKSEDIFSIQKFALATFCCINSNVLPMWLQAEQAWCKIRRRRSKNAFV